MSHFPTLTKLEEIIAGLPVELSALTNIPVWQIWIKSPVNVKPKYTGIIPDDSLHYTLNDLPKYWKDNSVLVLNSRLANASANKILMFCDIDFYTNIGKFDHYEYKQISEKTWTGISPSGNGAHALFFIPRNKVLLLTDKQPGYDWYAGNQLLTFGTGSNNKKIQDLSSKFYCDEQELIQTNSEIRESQLYMDDGRMSVPYVFNKTYSLISILEQNGCIKVKHNKYKHPDAEGDAGIWVIPSSQKGRDGEDVCLIFHGSSMGELCANKFSKGFKHKDAFELQAWFQFHDDYGKEYYKEAIKYWANDLNAINEQGEEI